MYSPPMPAKVMLIDDDHNILHLLVDALAKYPYEVATYWDAREAASALASRRGGLPAVIVTDVMMPGVDGYSFVNGLLEADETRAIPVIVITAKKNMIDVFRALPNVFVFLEKPFTITAFVDAVQRGLAKAGA